MPAMSIISFTLSFDRPGAKSLVCDGMPNAAPRTCHARQRCFGHRGLDPLWRDLWPFPDNALLKVTGPCDRRRNQGDEPPPRVSAVDYPCCPDG